MQAKVVERVQRCASLLHLAVQGRDEPTCSVFRFAPLQQLVSLADTGDYSSGNYGYGSYGDGYGDSWEGDSPAAAFGGW